MFSKVLIANRGEIAVRIIRTCRELGIPTVAVHSTADAGSTAVAMADEAVCIGPAPARSSYLHVPNVIGAALKTGADAIHPGYGFLSEDPYFAEICADNGIAFIGPPPQVVEAVGDKAMARALMADAGLPMLPGTSSPVNSYEEAAAAAEEIGYPVILKAVAGGGGRGIAVVPEPANLRTAYATTRASARATLGDSAIYLERYLASARHIEIQIVCDQFGNGIHLGERDCSVQRRHQKLIEEAPSPSVDHRLREELGAAALRGAKALGYRGAGTVEFLLDDDGQFWFMEINARIQVEHPVTEMVTGIDLIREQITVAAGRPLSVEQGDVQITGHAVECRINAEDVRRGFAPTPGLLDDFRPPGGVGVRVDTHCVPGTTVSPQYDSMIAKVITWAPDRDGALDRMRRALAELTVTGRGVSTTVPFHEAVLDHPAFRAGQMRTDFVTRHMRM
jgi:acetyl-CoA carboxylase biotin carboxylase subunit